VREFVAKLKTGTSGDTQAGLRVFKSRPKQNLIDSYGPDFERALRSATPGEWHAFETRDGWRAMRLTGITGAKPAVFETLRGVVLHDWRDAAASQQRTEAVRALAKKYTVKFEGAAESAAKPNEDTSK
jgi:parvulin-like peptidyl-prolyl isomerase